MAASYEGFNARVEFTPVAAGTYYVAAGSIDEFGGTYTLSVTESADVGDDYADGTGTTGTVTVGGEVMGEIETLDDRDWFAVTLEAGKTYQIDLEGSETGAAPSGTRICTESTTRPATSSPAPRTTTAA